MTESAFTYKLLKDGPLHWYCTWCSVPSLQGVQLNLQKQLCIVVFEVLKDPDDGLSLLGCESKKNSLRMGTVGSSVVWTRD